MDINKEEHFKLYILNEHRFTFESELNKHGIDFYSDAEEQVFSSHSIRYYLKTTDREQINQIIVNNKIDSGLESGGLNRFEIGPKPFKILIGVAIVIILIISILASLIS